MNVTTAEDKLAFLILYASDSTKYAYNNTLQQWQQFTNLSTAYSIAVARSNSGQDWTELSTKSLTGIPKAGYLVLHFVHDYSVLGVLYRYIKDVQFTVEPNIQGLRRNLIRGEYDRYTIARDVVKNYEETIALSDAQTNIYKGAIYEDDGFTLTDAEWYRRRYNSERYAFRRQNALGRWFMNRSYKTKLDVNLYGLKWDISGTDYPIGIMNTLKFVDDAPTKIYAITNLKEVDFMSCIWSASLVEVYFVESEA